MAGGEGPKGAVTNVCFGRIDPFTTPSGNGCHSLRSMPGWNYKVRLYRPRAEILDGKCTFPEGTAGTSCMSKPRATR